MTTYKVNFFKDLMSSDGHQFKCLQRAVEIRRARSVERAIQAAERRYARVHRVSDWSVHADSFEVEIDGRKINYLPSGAGRPHSIDGKHH
jgi:hypothetical protein